MIPVNPTEPQGLEFLREKRPIKGYDPNNIHSELAKACTEHFSNKVTLIKTYELDDFTTDEDTSPVKRFDGIKSFTVVCEDQKILDEIREEFIGNWLLEKPVFYTTDADINWVSDGDLA
jgi:hypothetical protein